MSLTKSLRIPCSTDLKLCQVPSGAGITCTYIKLYPMKNGNGNGAVNG